MGCRAFHGTATRWVASAGRRRLARERDPDPGPADRGGANLGRPAARRGEGRIDRPGQGRALRDRVHRGLQAGRHARGRDQRHRDHRRAAGQFGQAGVLRGRSRWHGAADLVPGWSVGVAEPAAADAAVHGCDRARRAAVHGDSGRRTSGVDLPVQDLGVERHSRRARRARPGRDRNAVRRCRHRDLARPRRDRPVQRTGAARGPDLAAGGHSAHLREVPAAGGFSVQSGPHRDGAQRQPGYLAVAGRALRSPVRSRAATRTAASRRPRPPRCPPTSTR